ncbi:MAG: helix-turn-helix domain-containing protein [Acidimicrobiales bacterium]
MAAGIDGIWKEHWRNVGEFIREQRRLAELSQRDLARLVNLSDTYMSQLERGLHEPSIRVLKSIADGLGVSAEQLIAFASGLQGDRQPPVSTEDAIRSDPRLTDQQRRALLSVLRSYLDENA